MKIQHKRSNQLDGGEAKAPLVEYMEYGELAVNFNTEDPAIFVKVSDGVDPVNDEVIRIAGLGSISGGVPDGPSSERPDGPSLGDLYFDTDLNLLLYWNGDSWQPVGKDNVAIISETAPNPQTENLPEGTFWWDSSEDSGRLFVLYNDPTDENELLWVEASPGGGGGSKAVVSEDAPPPSAYIEGDMWWNCSSDSGQLFILYDDPVDNGGGGKTWVAAAPSSGDGAAKTTTSDTPPSNPKDGELWWNTNDNTLYIYYDEGGSGTAQWVIASPAGGGDGGVGTLQEVTDAGNNTTNNITLGTDKIVLNADGSANFRRTVDLFDAGGAERAIRLQPRFGGFVEIISSGANDDATVFQAIPDASANPPNVKFTKGGKAEFAGNVTIGVNPTATSTYIQLQPVPGAITVRTSRSDDPALSILNDDGSGDAKAVINGNGSVDLSSFIRANYFTRAPGSGGIMLLGPDGFQRLVPCSDTDGSLTNNAMDIGESSNRFKGVYATVARMGNFVVELDQDNNDNYTVTTEEYEEQEELTPYVPAVPATYDEYGNELTAEVLEAQATYQTVTKTRDIRTYTGPTLDVKERLTKADNALIALKTAAAAATDFAELKAAIATALADI